MQPDNLRAVRGFRKQIGKRTDQVRDSASFFIWIFSWAKDVTLQVNRLIAVRQDRRDGDAVSVFNREASERSFHRLGIGFVGKADAQHLFAFVGLNALDLDLAQLTGDQNAARELKRLVERLLAT